MKLENYKKLTTVIDIFRSLHPDLPLPLIMVFLEIGRAGKKGLTASEVERRCDISQSASSRHCRMLTNQSVRGRKGHDLCDYYQDKDDRRITYFTLNSKGRKLLAAIDRALD